MSAPLIGSYLVMLVEPIAAQLAVLVVAILIRSRRPDVFPLLLASSLVGVGRMIVFTALSAAVPMYSMRTHGVSAIQSDGYGLAMLTVSIASAMTGAFGWFLLLAAIWKLARPQPHPAA